MSYAQRQIIEQTKFEYSPLAKAFGKQTKQQVSATKSLDSFNKLKQIDDIFAQGFMNYLIQAKLKRNCWIAR